MPVSAAPSISIENYLLAALPHGEYERLRTALKPIRIAQGTVIYDASDIISRAYFLIGGMASLLSITEDGSTIEIGVIGNEGMVGIPIILGFNTAPYQVVAQIVADALEIKTEALKEAFNRGEKLHDLLLRYTHVLLCQIAQTVVCNRFHTTEKRLCQWLLISRDRVHSATLPLTQEFIAQMLGIPRTHVTMTMANLQQKNLIRCTCGKITIINHQGLEAAACECYRIVKEEIESFLDA